MRALRVAGVLGACLAAGIALAPPAFATTFTTYDPIGDYARWNSDTNMLTVCDVTPTGGTAEAILTVDGGGSWTKFDGNGAQPGCGVAGPLSVDDSKMGYLYVCPDTYHDCYPTRVHM